MMPNRFQLVLSVFESFHYLCALKVAYLLFGRKTRVWTTFRCSIITPQKPENPKKNLKTYIFNSYNVEFYTPDRKRT
jgi:hypothetical protein